MPVDTKKRASAGGRARAASMSKEERRRAAARAAGERWARIKGLPKETHTGTIEIGDIKIPCAVLEGGRRVIPRAGIRSAFRVRSRSQSAGSGDDGNIPGFLASGAILPFVSAELREVFSGSIAYRPKDAPAAGIGYAYPAEILPLICEALLDASLDPNTKLQPTQRNMAGAAGVLHRALARVGITALVDEATGYQYERARDELQRLLEAYVVEEMRPWVRLFPNEFFKQVYRLHGWRYETGVTQGPRYVGKLINRYVYEQLPAPVVEEIRNRNPVVNGRRAHKHHQFLTHEIGEPHLDRQILSVLTLMRAAPDKRAFDEMFTRAFPKAGDQMPLNLPPRSDETEE